MQCKACGAHTPSGATICQKCGVALTRVCAACGGKIAVAARFCSECGVRQPRLPEDPSGETSNALVGHGERRQLTVMFCDLVESTALSERLDPEDLLEVIRRYQRQVGETVQHYDGHVAQYLGDGLLVYFGYPRAHEDDGRRAVLSGLEIIRSMTELSAALERERGITLAVRIGVHTGAVVAAEIGHGEQMALGSTPNIAAKVQQVAAPGEVLLTDSSYALVERFVDCSSLGPRELHGLTEPVALFRAIGPAPADRARRPTAESMRTPFVGRDDALEAVLACYHRAEQGHGQAVFVTAEAGLGKSRLVQEVQLRTEAAARWLTCWCSPYEQNTSLFSVIELVERLFELAPGTDPVARLRALERRVERFGLDAPDAVPLLGTLLSLPVGPSEAAMLGPGARSRTLNTLVELVRHLSRETPVVFAVEDLHWADPSTLDFVTLLVTRIAEERVLLLLTGRPEVEPTWPAGPNQTSIQLQPLSERHAEQLLVQWSTGRELPLGIVREVIERTEGVPLFLEELTKAVVDTGMAALKSPGPMPEPDVSKVIPNSLRDSLTARLDRLGDAKETAQLAAVIGSGLRPQMLHAVGSLGYETMQDHLAQLVTSGLLYRVGESPHERFYFKHALIQETAYGTLLKSRQRQIHDHIVRVVHESFPTILDDEPEKLAWHCEEAGRIEDAIDAFERAAARATTRWAYVEASRSLQKALVLLDRVEASERRDERELRLLEALQAPVFATRGYTAPELPGIYDRIRALAKEKGTPIGEFALLARSWGFHCVHGDRQETLDLADEILESWSTSELPTRALAGWMLGATYFYSGQHARALQFLNPCVEFFHRGVTDPAVATPLFLASLTRGWALALAGYPVQALATLEAAVAAAESFGDPFAITQALTHLMIAEYDLGCEPDPIQRHAARALELSAARHLPQTLNSARAHLGWAAAAKGDERGIEEARQAVAGMRAIGTLNPVGTLIILLADAQWRLGRHDAALEAIEECLQECATNLARHHEPHAYLLKGTLLWQKRDRRGAEQCLRTALEVARAQDAKIFELRAATALARLAAEDGRATDGNAELAAVYHWFREGSDSRYLREAKGLLDQLSPAQAGRVPLA